MPSEMRHFWGFSNSVRVYYSISSATSNLILDLERTRLPKLFLCIIIYQTIDHIFALTFQKFSEEKSSNFCDVINLEQKKLATLAFFPKIILMQVLFYVRFCVSFFAFMINVQRHICTTSRASCITTALLIFFLYNASAAALYSLYIINVEQSYSRAVISSYYTIFLTMSFFISLLSTVF